MLESPEQGGLIMGKVRLVFLGLCALGCASSAALAFQVNEFSDGDQTPEDVAVGDDGFIVVWRNGQGGSQPAGVYAQRYDAGGVSLGSAFQVTAPGSGAQRDGVVSIAADNAFVIAWEDVSTVPPDNDEGSIRVQRYDSLGVPVGTSVVVNTFTAGHQSAPVIAHDATGNFTVAWTSANQDGDSSGVFAQRFDSTASPLGTEFQVNTYTTGGQASDRLAIAAAPGGSFVITWHSRAQDDGDPSVSGGGVYAQLYDSAGAPVGGEFQVNTSTAGAQGLGGVDAAMDAAGNFVLAWNDNNEGPPFFLPGGDIVAQRYDSSGAPIGGEIAVNTDTGGPQFGPSIAMTGSGDFVVAFQTPDFDRNGISGRSFASDGTAIGDEFVVSLQSRGEQDGPVAGGSSDGHFVVAWGSECRSFNTRCDEDEDGDGKGVFARRFDTAVPVCGAAPLTGCFDAGKSRLALLGTGSGKLKWTWGGGPAFDGENFGVPTVGLTNYVFCLYHEDGGAPALIMEAAIPSGGLCDEDTKPCWKHPKAQTRVKYKDVDELSDGIAKVAIRGGRDGHGKISVKGRGPLLPLPTFPIGPFTTVTGQLVNGNGECWQTEHTEAQANTDKKFKSKF